MQASIPLESLKGRGDDDDNDDGDDDDNSAGQFVDEEVKDRTEYEKAENFQLETIKFIKETFKQRECISFFPDPNINGLCQCGYNRDEHRKDINIFKKTKWDVETCTEIFETDAFGVVEFPAYGQKTSKFIRVDYKTDVNNLWQLMHNKWQMDMPRLLISVTGGAQKLVMKASLKEVFRKGLVEAAQSTGAWIITGGTNTGVMKEVGEAIRAHALKQGSRKQLIAIGIATWGCIENLDALIGNREALYECAHPTEGKKEGKKESPLDPNHTHFILVDNGTRNQYGAEIELRAALENKISNMKACGVKIPIVCIAIEGGTNTVETVKQAISANTPVIIVEGSGRAADVLAYAYNHYTLPSEDTQKQQAVKEANDRLRQELKSRIVEELKPKKPDDVLHNIDFCLKNRNMINVVRLDDKRSTLNIDVAIIMTLLKVKQSETSTFDQLSLALAWDRIDAVKEHIYTDEVKLTADEFEELAFNAIVNNRVEFVKFFLERRLRLSDLLAKYKIEDFYKEAMKTSQHLKDIFKDAETLDKHPTKLNNFIFKLVNRLFDPATCRVKQGLQRQQSGSAASKMLALMAKPPAAIDDAAMELFFWAILTRMKSMAVVFLYEAKETFALSLIGHLMLKNLLKRAKDSESVQELQRQVDFYEDLTTGLLAECYSSNQEMTIDLLVRQTFDRLTALEIAVQGDNQSFIAHQACQTLLAQIWLGNISDDNPSYKMLLAIPGFLLAPLFLKFRKETSTVRSETAKDSAADEKDLKIPTKRKASSSSGTAGPKADAQSVQSKENPCSVYFKRLGYFVTAPFVKFSFNCVSYAVLLLLYSIILLTNFYPTISIAEYVLIVWVITIVCEEIRQIVTGREGGSRKFYNYFSDKWNVVDVIAICTFAIGLVLRVIPLSLCGRCFFAARIVLAVNLMTFYFRILHMFSIRRELGPKLVMIGKMMIDLLYFMTILLVFVVAYGIAAHVILYPNQELRLALVRDVLSGAWWSVYGEFHIEEVSGDKCEAAAWQKSSAERCASMEYDDFNRTLCPGKEEQCPAIDWFVPILLAIYALITNVMMINLLIAMFSNTFAKVEGIADVVWKIQRYHLVLEYESHPILPPPLIVIEHAYLLSHCIFCKLRGYCQKKTPTNPPAKPLPNVKHTSRKRKFKMVFGEYYERDLMAWLKAIVEEYLLKKESEDAAVDRLAKETNERIDQVLRKVEEIGDTRNLDERLKSLEEQVLTTRNLDERLKPLEEQMNQIIELLSENR